MTGIQNVIFNNQSDFSACFKREEENERHTQIGEDIKELSDGAANFAVPPQRLAHSVSADWALHPCN